jgi:ABC-2 type transport system ATP-binding protein
MSTPYLDEAERCTRVALMNKGSVMQMATPSAMKAAMTGEVLEIVPERVRNAFAVLKSHPRAREVQAFGDRLNVMVESAARDGPSLRRSLDEAHIAVTSIRRIDPSLENVFISLLSQASDVRGEA